VNGSLKPSNFKGQFVMDTLRRNDRGFKVQLMQRLINKVNQRDGVRGTVALVEDGVFGPRTADAVSLFKSRKRLVPNDPVCGLGTWRELGVQREKEHLITLVGQPTSTSCWAAAAMMLAPGLSVGPGGALLRGGGLIPGPDNMQLFATAMGWRLVNHTPGLTELVELVMAKPVWIVGSGTNWAHAVVLSGVYSDLDNRGNGTMFRIHDPWPVSVGAIYGSFANPISIRGATGTATVPASLDGVIVPA
jgi:peptidoglycan hydrolase-like protein with peptidoglycan-binding domain